MAQLLNNYPSNNEAKLQLMKKEMRYCFYYFESCMVLRNKHFVKRMQVYFEFQGPLESDGKDISVTLKPKQYKIQSSDYCGGGPVMDCK